MVVEPVGRRGASFGCSWSGLGLALNHQSQEDFLTGSPHRSVDTGEEDRRHLKDRGYRSIREAAQAQTSPDAVDETFGTSLKGFLNRGDFRFVMVLDEVPERLNRITAYLDEMTEQALTIDLIVIKVHEENGTQIATPQRITPGA